MGSLRTAEACWCMACRLKGISFETAIIERYYRRESSVEESLIGVYLVGVSVRRMYDVSEVLWRSMAFPSPIIELKKNVYTHIWRRLDRSLQCGRYQYFCG